MPGGILHRTGGNDKAGPPVPLPTGKIPDAIKSVRVFLSFFFHARKPPSGPNAFRAPFRRECLKARQDFPRRVALHGCRRDSLGLDANAHEMG